MTTEPRPHPCNEFCDQRRRVHYVAVQPPGDDAARSTPPPDFREALAEAFGWASHNLTTGINHKLATPTTLDEDCAVLGRAMVMDPAVLAALAAIEKQARARGALFEGLARDSEDAALDRSVPAEGLREALDVDRLREAARRAGLPHEVTVAHIEDLAREYIATSEVDERAAIEYRARLEDALDALTSEPFASPHIWRNKARSGAVAVRLALAATPTASPTDLEVELDHIAWAERVRNEHEATHGEAEMCGAECIVLGLADFDDEGEAASPTAGGLDVEP